MSQEPSQNQIEALLKQEIKLCQASVTGYLVVCALVTDQGIYLGHNIEHEGSVVFEHAETEAIKKMLEQEPAPVIKKIVMFGRGRTKKIKIYTPCTHCVDALRPYTTDQTTIHLMPHEGMTERAEFHLTELEDCYRTLPYSKFSSKTVDEFKQELKHKTILGDQEIPLVADLAVYGLKNAVSFYLMGSASGRAAASGLLMKKTGRSYRDVDFIVVTKRDAKAVEREIEAVMSSHLGPFKKEVRPIKPHHSPSGAILIRSYYFFGPNAEHVVDITVASELRGAFNNSAYEQKNWFHQLS